MENCPVELLLAGLIEMAIKSIKMEGSVKLHDTIKRCIVRVSRRFK
jgi:hypothetical protein